MKSEETAGTGDTDMSGKDDKSGESDKKPSARRAEKGKKALKGEKSKKDQSKKDQSKKDRSKKDKRAKKDNKAKKDKEAKKAKGVKKARKAEKQAKGGKKDRKKAKKNNNKGPFAGPVDESAMSVTASEKPISAPEAGVVSDFDAHLNRSLDDVIGLLEQEIERLKVSLETYRLSNHPDRISIVRWHVRTLDERQDTLEDLRSLIMAERQGKALH